MAFSYEDWNEIVRKITAIISKRGEPFVQGEVVKSDPVNKLVWLSEFGITPIPLFGMDYQVIVYDETPTGTTRKVYRAEMLTPIVGETVLVAQHFGTSRLPKCLGVVHSTNYEGLEEEEGD